MSTLSCINTEPRTRREWAERITHRWGRALDAIFAVGDELLAAKEALAHGEFTKMCRRDLPFRERQAQRLMAIARHPVLSDPAYRAHLPVSITTLDMLAGCDEDRLRLALDHKLITPWMTSMQVALQVQMAPLKQSIETRKAALAPPPEPIVAPVVPISPDPAPLTNASCTTHLEPEPLVGEYLPAERKPEPPPTGRQPITVGDFPADTNELDAVVKDDLAAQRAAKKEVDEQLRAEGLEIEKARFRELWATMSQEARGWARLWVIRH